jgi:peptidoglycan/xylan/chitin deacetylase (PgdA/CDA1 family)
MKDLARKAVLGSGVLGIAARFRGHTAAILMYHSVLKDPRSQDEFLGKIGHSEEVFRAQMELLARQYHPVDLDQIARFVRGKAELPARAVAVTFDDGYVDNYQVAAPILNQVGVPAAVYATVDCVERHRLPWPSHLRFLFRNTRKGIWVDSSGKTWPLWSEVERENALLSSCDDCCKLIGPAQNEYLSLLGDELDLCVPVESGALMMNYEHLRKLATQGHIVGSHTMTHPNMAYLNAEDARHELIESKRRLELELNIPVVHFSYPCPALSPHWSEATLKASGDAGYQSAVTTDYGLVRAGDSPLRLKRILPTKTLDGLRWNLECAFAGRGI